MIPRTFSSRIFLTFSALLAILLLAGAWFGRERIEELHENEVRERLALVADLLTPVEVAALESDRPVETLNGGADLRVTVIRDDGVVISDSAASLPLTNHRGRPELEQARRDGSGVSRRRSATTGGDTFFLARRLTLPGGGLGFIRVSTKLDPMELQASFLINALVLGGLAALILGLLGSAILSRYLFNVMSAELHDRVKGLHRSRSETQAILDSMREGVIAVTPEETVLLMNEAAAGRLQLAAPLDPGENLWKAVQFPELEMALRRVLAGERSWQGDTESPLGDGRILSISVTSVEPRIGAVAILSDVTAIRRLEKVRIDFVANVSHEMRTPLAALLGALETLAESDISPEEHARFLDIGRRNALRMQLIVADLLELSHIEVEGHQMPLEPTAIESPVRTSASALSGAAEAKQVTLNIESPGESPILVPGNAKRLEQVFTNLIDNAIKYTPAGGCITIRFRPSAETVIVDVTDTGLGIPEAALPRVFERFYRVDKSRSRAMGGTGLGLAIVKHAARAHGGQVDVRSEEGVGTTFSVTLPRIARSPAPASGNGRP